MMRSFPLYLLLALLVLLAVLSSGCVLPGGSTQGGDGGITDITEYTRERATLDEALSALRQDEQKGLVDLTGMRLTQVLGIRVDRAGAARTWTLGYRGEGNTTRILEYTGGAWEMVDVELPLPEEPIPLDQLIRPKRLFEMQKAPIGEAYARQGVNESELLLRGGTYTLTIPSAAGTTILTFDARTGGVSTSS